MENNHEQFTKFLKLLDLYVQTLERLSSEQIDSLIDGTGTLVYKRSRTKQRMSREQSVEHSPLYHELLSVESREEALALLSNVSKTELTALAHQCKVLVFKSDNRANLKKKIIESVIGAKLGYEAIQGTNLKGSSSLPSQD
jgi:hypothetical protein